MGLPSRRPATTAIAIGLPKTGDFYAHTGIRRRKDWHEQECGAAPWRSLDSASKPETTSNRSSSIPLCPQAVKCPVEAFQQLFDVFVGALHRRQAAERSHSREIQRRP